jgi:hypothetical protein
MRLLCVTTFNAELFEASGRRLVRTFLRHSDPVSSLLVCHEGGCGNLLPPSPSILPFDLDRSAFLRDWLQAHRDIIPVHLGGLAVECDCPHRGPFDDHEGRCHWFWFNKNASRWFRKIVALDAALQLDGFDALLWLDSDTRFKRRLPAEVVEEWFGGDSVFFFKSPQRRVMESGVLGVRLDEGGRRFLGATIERYRSGEFRRYERWDDGYHFQTTLWEDASIRARDLATRKTGGTFVLPNSPAARYLGHDKGLHRRARIML